MNGASRQGLEARILLAALLLGAGQSSSGFGGAPPVHEQPAALRDQPAARVLEVKVLAAEPGRYVGWPTIAEAASGDLIVVYSGDRDAHISPDGKIRLIRSRDRGRTWSSPITIADTPLDDRDAGILRTKSGTLIVSWFTAVWGAGVPEDAKRMWLGNLILRSRDDGRTWSKPSRSHVSTPHGPIQLGDGRLLVMGQYPHESQRKPYTVSIEESRDDGLTWRVISRFPVPPGVPMLTYDEPHLVEVGPEKLIALFRDCHGEHPIRQAESADGGITWSRPHITPMRGLPPHVIRLRNGWLLVVYGKRWPPYGEYACVSRDGGKTWDVKREILLSSAPGGDLGYPASIELDDGTIWTVYYQVNRMERKPVLMGTRWRLKSH